jgi:hypothetical protein
MKRTLAILVAILATTATTANAQSINQLANWVNASQQKVARQLESLGYKLNSDTTTSPLVREYIKGDRVVTVSKAGYEVEQTISYTTPTPVTTLRAQLKSSGYHYKKTVNMGEIWRRTAHPLSQGCVLNPVGTPSIPTLIFMEVDYTKYPVGLD